MKTTTLTRIRSHGPCDTGWKQLLRHLGKTQADDEELPFAVILESNGLADALWCLRAEPQFAAEWRLMACAFAREVTPLNTDPRVMGCIEVAERFARGEASEEELRVARDAAALLEAAADYSADTAARDAAYAAARAACVAAWPDAYAATAAHCGSRLAQTATWNHREAGATKEKQKEIFLQFVA